MVALTRWLYRKADAIVGVSSGVSRDLESVLRLAPGSVTTIPNPIDVQAIRAATDQPVPQPMRIHFEKLPRPVLITAGRLVEEKAHRDLLEAFARLPGPQRGSLVILGEGPLRQGLEDLAVLHGISERLWMPGFVDNPWWYMARSNAFVLSSHFEGFGLVLVEALACGIPVASTDCPSGPSEILSGVSGTRLTAVGDVQHLSEAIVDVLNQGSLTEGNDNFSAYSPDRIAASYRAVVNAVVAAR
jgi:glycosyltransferase involved in cell wall biosynthesis